MTNYVESTLVEGEKIMCAAHYHWFWWLKRIVFYVLITGIGIAIDKSAHLSSILATIVVLISIIGLCYAYLRYTYDEIVITNHRVVLKTRIIARDVFEMQIQKVETILVDQTVIGRIFDYGTISCRGTGGTMSGGVGIAAPLAFRAAFQTAIKESQAAAPAYADVAPAVTLKEPESLDNARLDEIISLLKEISNKLDR